MKKSLIFCLLLFVIFNLGCLVEDDEDEGTGVIKVTVKTSTVVWGYPSATDAYSGAGDLKPDYTEVGGDGTLATLPTPATYYPLATWSDKKGTQALTSKGDLKNYVYIFSAIEQKSDNNPVLYKGVSDVNNTEIAITGLKPGTYYVVAFYNYGSGGDETNVLNRYDRYALYAETGNALTGNSTPYYDKAATITVGEDETVEITLDINKDWVLGKPKADNREDVNGNGVFDGAEVDADGDGVIDAATITYEMGRYFLKESDGIPTP